MNDISTSSGLKFWKISALKVALKLLILFMERRGSTLSRVECLQFSMEGMLYFVCVTEVYTPLHLELKLFD